MTDAPLSDEEEKRDNELTEKILRLAKTRKANQEDPENPAPERARRRRFSLPKPRADSDDDEAEPQSTEAEHQNKSDPTVKLSTGLKRKKMTKITPEKIKLQIIAIEESVCLTDDDRPYEHPPHHLEVDTDSHLNIDSRDTCQNASTTDNSLPQDIPISNIALLPEIANINVESEKKPPDIV